MKTLLCRLCVGLLLGAASVFSQPAVADQWFIDYGEISWQEERLLLDNFAVYLNQNPEMIGYITFYLENEDHKPKMQKRISRARQYLIRKRKVEAESLVTKYAGKSSSTRTILQPVLKTVEPPAFE